MVFICNRQEKMSIYPKTIMKIQQQTISIEETKNSENKAIKSKHFIDS